MTTSTDEVVVVDVDDDVVEFGTGDVNNGVGQRDIGDVKRGKETIIVDEDEDEDEDGGGGGVDGQIDSFREKRKEKSLKKKIDC